MSDSNNIVVPGSVTTNDKRRFRIIPLTTNTIERAGIGEIAVDRDTGDLYVINDAGEPVCRTANIETTIQNVVNSDMNSLSYMYNRNRRVYRLFFNDDMLRLDTNLVLDESNYYYRVRDLSDNGKYYVADLTPIGSTAAVDYPLIDNEMYFVEFYNRNKEQISMLPFSAKSALYFDTNDEIIAAVRDIIVYTNKDSLYKDEDISSLLIKVYAEYEDGGRKDITDYTTVSLTNNIDTSTLGDYTISATWLYDTENDLTLSAEKIVSIIEDKSTMITDMVVTPKKILNLNDGSRGISLMVIVYYADGTTEDVSDRAIISNFDNTLFNEEQNIVVKLNAGLSNVYQQVYTIEVDDDGGASSYKLLFTNDNILDLDETTRDAYPAGAAYYRVRECNNLNFYFTPDYNELHYPAIYAESSKYTLSSSKNVIVEFYDKEYELIDSDIYASVYQETLGKHGALYYLYNGFNAAASYSYDDGYSYYTNADIIKNNNTGIITVNMRSNDGNIDDYKSDLNRLLGAIYLYNSGATVDSIIYNDVMYSWDVNVIDNIIKWNDGSSNLVDVVSNDIDNSGTTVKMNINDIDVIFRLSLANE